MSDILNLIRLHENYRSKTLNLVASENIMSLTARRALSSDLVHRYSDYDFYGGAKYAEELVKATDHLILEVFGGTYASCEPLSGNIAHIAPLLAFSKPGDKVAVVPPEYGGYPFRYREFYREPVYLRFDVEKFNLDPEGSKDVILEEKPKIVFLGASVILFPQPVRPISEVAHEVGAVVVYDASHVLGLIAGKTFQDPLREGADIIVASTHKTLGGPQGGLVIAKNEELGKELDRVIKRPPLLVDNPHLHRIAALAITLLEMKKYGREYAQQIVRNSKTLANKLHDLGLELVGKGLGYTESHQVYIPKSKSEGRLIRDKLERANIIVDALVRIGTQEVTRRGMKEPEMIDIAEAIGMAIRGKIKEAKEIAQQLAEKFKKVHYSFDE